MYALGQHGQGLAHIDHLTELGSKKISSAHSKSPRKQYFK
jgi:hypothetical protein